MLTEELMKEVRRLEIRSRRRVDDIFGGEYHSAFKGEGIEFAEVREYEPGDDVRTIDWNVTARAGRPFVKRFVEERQLTVILAVDLSASGAFGSGAKSKARLAIETGAVIAAAAARNNDRVGLILFDDDVRLYLPPSKGRGHVLRVLRELLDAEPRAGSAGLPDALRTLDRVLHRRSIIFVLSDFLAQASSERGGRIEPEWLTPARRLARRHEVSALTIEDPRERTLPRLGLIELVDPETGRRTVFDAGSRSSRARLASVASREDAELTDALRRARIDRVALSTDRPFVDDLLAYFRVRGDRR
ncbi:MAG: hypothetical protein DHS20C14_21110 [Phycisphaeraceae bacterium]|nr:MAG: hypothetical protein DHS20C14_21110 [Phycisphaeraceae bacterium]